MQYNKNMDIVEALDGIHPNVKALNIKWPEPCFDLPAYDIGDIGIIGIPKEIKLVEQNIPKEIKVALRTPPFIVDDSLQHKITEASDLSVSDWFNDKLKNE